MILRFVIFEFGLRTSAYKFFLQLQSSSQNVRHSARGQDLQISTCCVKPSSHHSIEGVGSFPLPELQNTTYTEGTVLLIFSKDEDRRAQC